MAYLKRDHEAIPALRMMNLHARRNRHTGGSDSGKIRASNLSLEVIDGESVIGGGAAPSAVLRTRLLALKSGTLTADELSARLRASNPPIIARVEEGRVLLDLRTVFPERDR